MSWFGFIVSVGGVNWFHQYNVTAAYSSLETTPTGTTTKPCFDFSVSKRLLLCLSHVLKRMVLAVDLFLILQNCFLCNVFQLYITLRNPEYRYATQTSWVSPKFTEQSRHTIDNGTQSGRGSHPNWLYNDPAKYLQSQRGLGFPWWLGQNYSVCTMSV